MHSKKRLIVNADDFGLDTSINLGIIEAFKNGIVTNASLSTCGSAFDEAIWLARENEDLGVGIHLVINEEEPVLSDNRIKSLLKDDRARFLDFPDFLKRYFSGRIISSHIYSEFEAQIEKFLKAGLKPTHLDSHKHVHLLPGVFDILVDLAKKFKISHIRMPNTIFNYTLILHSMPLRTIGIIALSTLAKVQLHKLNYHNIKAPDSCLGLLESGNLTEGRLFKILHYLPCGTHELMCHPAFCADDLSKRYKWKYKWEVELNALKSEKTKAAIKDSSIYLIKYNEI